MDGDKKIISIVKAKEPEKPDIDDVLVSFLEQQLQWAKEGKIQQFVCVSNTTVEDHFIKRLYSRPVRQDWIVALGFVEIMNDEVERVRQFIKRDFEN